MNVVDVIRAPKSNVDIGTWRTGHVPRAAFPLSKAKSKAYKFGPEYSWRIVSFECLGVQFRVFILLNENKQIYRATLASETNNDMTVLCQHEWHVSEPGWHCHVSFLPAAHILPGIVRGHLRPWPRPSSRNVNDSFEVTKQNSLYHAERRFKFSEEGELV